VLYDHAVSTEDKRTFQKIAMIYWAPDAARVHEKMLYSSAKNALKTEVQGITLEMQACDMTEMTIEEVDARIRQIIQN
jgi:cofilin